MKNHKSNIWNLWRYYTLGREEYMECMGKMSAHNSNALWIGNMICAVMAVCFVFFPVFVERDLPKAGIYLIVVGIAVLLAFLSRRKINEQGKRISSSYVYILIALYYINIILFGIYLGVWANPENTAVSFMCILICALFLFNNPPVFNLSLTLGAVVVFSISSVLGKGPETWSLDIVHAAIAGNLSLILTWYVTKYRILAVIGASKLENERNNYFDQSMIDELTQLKNRRCFDQTLQRYLTNYRDSDNFLCLAIVDIDFFKNYNDFYGHPKGDECLRAVGKALNNLKNSLGIYAARIGGEEFALLWFEKEKERVNKIVSQLQQQIKDLNIPHEKSSIAQYLTVSIGIDIMRCGSSFNPQDIYNSADSALYEAKRSGRNRAIIRDN